ncbi:hypothetical protein [Microbacterium oxydans]
MTATYRAVVYFEDQSFADAVETLKRDGYTILAVTEVGEQNV